MKLSGSFFPDGNLWVSEGGGATHAERLVVWTLLDTGLRVSELAGQPRRAPNLI